MTFLVDLSKVASTTRIIVRILVQVLSQRHNVRHQHAPHLIKSFVGFVYSFV